MPCLLHDGADCAAGVGEAAQYAAAECVLWQWMMLLECHVTQVIGQRRYATGRSRIRIGSAKTPAMHTAAIGFVICGR